MVILITGQTILPNFQRLIIMTVIINDNNKVPSKTAYFFKICCTKYKKQNCILTRLMGFVCTLIDSVADVA